MPNIHEPKSLIILRGIAFINGAEAATNLAIPEFLRKANPKAKQIVAFLSGIIRQLRPTADIRGYPSIFRDQKVAGSNPVTSTTKVGRFAIAYQLFLMQ